MGLIFGASPDHRQRALAQEVVARHYRRSPNALHRYGPAGQEKCVCDTHYTLMHLEAAASCGSFDLFREYIAWVHILFARLGIATDDLTGSLSAMREVLTEEGAAEAVEFLDHVIRLIPDLPTAAASSHIEDDGPLARLARDYMDSILAGNRRAAGEAVTRAAGEGVKVRDLYMQVFQPCLREIGRLWQAGEISVAQEHYFTAATQNIMAQLYPFIFDRPSNGRRLVAACAAGELHEIGVRMIADLFEMDGWETTYVGASTPAPALVRLLCDTQPDVLALSCTLTPNVPAVAGMIGHMRGEPACRGVKVLVGGAPFNQSPGLWHQLGADGWARDAATAVDWAGRL
jgi:methanogenic corrinoid protein MtbC1